MNFHRSADLNLALYFRPVYDVERLPGHHNSAVLADEYGWSDVPWCGLGRCRWRHVYEDQWREEERIFVFSSRGDRSPTPEQLSQWAREHWHVENRLFWVLDVTYREDRQHARRIGPVLHFLRAVAIGLIRWQGFRDVPDGRLWPLLALTAASFGSWRHSIDKPFILARTRCVT